MVWKFEMNPHPDSISHVCWVTHFQNNPLNHVMDAIATMLSLKLFANCVWVVNITLIAPDQSYNKHHF